jgi:CoA:oxalate CoA-transferase
MTDTKPKGALDGITVIDFSHMRAGPQCTQMLGDMGATVIKIEAPDGDGTRKFGKALGGESVDFLSVNRNKKSIVLDLKNEEDLAFAHQLVASADVVVENFRMGVMKRFGLDYESLAEKYPRLVYCTVSAYGLEGPYAGRPGYDQVAQGLSGLMSVTGTEESGPVRVGVSIADLLGGVFSAYGVALALYEREKSGRGQFVHTSLLRSLVSMLSYQAARYLLTGEVPEVVGNHHPIVVPTGTFKAGDGLMTISCGTDRQWQLLCDALESPELKEDPRYITNRDRTTHLKEIIKDIEARLSKKTRAQWMEILDRHGVPAGPVNRIDEVINDPQVIADQLIVTPEQPHPTIGNVPMPGFPVVLTRTPASARLSPPMLGQHTDEIKRMYTAKQTIKERT